MRKVWIIFILIISFYGCNNSYPDAKDLPRKEGEIIHPVYGSYPEIVPFEQGMTLMPGQSAEVSILMILKESKK